tara:strand:+ start:308 stop:469 length:162 start_codon:yes stop_codon:yes gene_type:complete
MKKLLILILFLSISCTSVQTEQKVKLTNELTIEEFKSNLRIYVDISEYPNIDE